MENTEQVVEEVIQSRKAKKFNLWLGMIGMFMMFAALSSGFIVYTASGVDKGIKTLLPNAFIYSTITILLSSVTLYLAHNAAKKAKTGTTKEFLNLDVVTGFGFLWFTGTFLDGFGWTRYFLC